MSGIRCLIMDVDGTLTDGKIYMGPAGETMKAFDIKDGYAIRNILPEHEITPVIITGRHSSIVELRAKELGIKHLYQGVADKKACLCELAAAMDIPFTHIACIGDDLNDLSIMDLCGVNGCPSDAVQAVQKKCDYVCKASGGRGAVREFIEWLISAER